MKTNQKRAIWYSYRAKQLKHYNELLEKFNLKEEWKKSKYKYLTNFLRSKIKDGTLTVRDVYWY